MNFSQILAFSLSLLLFTTAKATSFEIKQIASNLGVPWGLEFINDSELIFTEREGRVGLVNLNSLAVEYLEGVPEVMAYGQGGLLDVAKSPKGDGKTLYFTYSKEQNGLGTTTLAKASLDGMRLINWQDIHISKSHTDSDVHYGSRIAFDDNDYVYYSIGDRGERDNAQMLDNHAGSVLRLNLDGSVPKDNPFASEQEALPEIWSYGHRNPQGLVWDSINQRLWSIEHGPRGGDELNLIEKGKNYGWPEISYGKEYWAPISVGEGTHKKGMEQPLKVYIPSIAPGDLMIYSANAFPQWQGNLFATALRLRHINRLVLDAQGKVIQEQRLLGDLDERIRAIKTAPNGWIYFSTDSGKIYAITPKN